MLKLSLFFLSLSPNFGYNAVKYSTYKSNTIVQKMIQIFNITQLAFLHPQTGCTQQHARPQVMSAINISKPQQRQSSCSCANGRTDEAADLIDFDQKSVILQS